MALECFRNTRLEDFHEGRYPASQTGDYSDVKVVTPFGEIAWRDVSRLSDGDMKLPQRPHHESVPDPVCVNLCTEEFWRAFQPSRHYGYRPRKLLDDMLKEPFDSFTFAPSNAAVYQLGQYGTAAKKLKEFAVER